MPGDTLAAHPVNAGFTAPRCVVTDNGRWLPAEETSGKIDDGRDEYSSGFNPHEFVSMESPVRGRGHTITGLKVHRDRVRRIAVAAVLVGLGILTGAGTADAHAAFASSQPTDGAALGGAPDEVWVEFTEPPAATNARFGVIDACGRAADDGEPRVVGRRITVGMIRTHPGAYTVSWRATSQGDTHTTEGSYAYRVAGADPCAPAAAPAAPADAHKHGTRMQASFPPSSGFSLAQGPLGATSQPARASAPGDSAIGVGALVERGGGMDVAALLSRILMLAGLLVGLGATTAAAAAARVPPWIPRSAAAAAAGGSLGLGFAAFLALDASVGGFLATRAGLAAVVRTAAMAFALAWLLVRPRPIWPAGAAFAGAALAHAFGGHAGGAVEVGVHWVHVLSVGVWLGGLAVLLATLRAVAPEQRSGALRRFSAVAGVTLFIAGGTGMIRALHEVGGWANLWSSTYGRIVVVKGVLFVLLGSIGGLVRWVYLPREGRSGSVLRAASIEIVVALLALVFSAVLAQTTPSSHAADPHAARAAHAGPGG